MRLIYLITVWLHVLAAVVWVGGMLFLALVLIPLLRQAEHAPHAARLLRPAGRRLRWIGWIALAVLVSTGAVSLAFRGYTWADLWTGRLWEGRFGTLLAHKVGTVAAMAALMTVHDFFLGPRALRLLEQEPDAARTRRLRALAAWSGRALVLLALVVVSLGILLVRGGL